MTAAEVYDRIERQQEAGDYDLLELAPLSECEACDDPTDTPPVCRACAEAAEALADEEADLAYRRGEY